MATTWSCRVCGSTNQAPVTTCSRCGTLNDRPDPSPAARPTRPQMAGEEWEALVFSPLWVFSAVAGADGVLDEREVRALVQVIERSSLAEAELLQEVLWDCSNDLDSLFARYRADPRTVDDGLRQVRDILDRRVSRTRAREFKRGLLAIGTHFAEASGGGLLRIADKVSAEERAALTLLAGLLDLPPEDVPGQA